MHSGKKENDAKPAKAKGAKEGGKPEGDLGNALRRAYDATVKESIPDDLLDLLKKLD